MLLKLSLTVLLLYYIGVLWRYYRSDLAGLLGKSDTGAEEETEGERLVVDEPYTVMGRSTYQPFGERDEPEEETERDGENGETDDARKGTDGDRQPETAAPETVEEPETADDDADYSDIEPEDDEEEEYMPSPEELEEDEELGAYYPDGNPDFATGYSFEDLKKVHRVLVTDDPDEREKREAREVLPAVMGSDVWEAMLDEFEGARQRVARLMSNNNV